MPSAAILAGGRASRFDGRDKSALAVRGRTILDRQLEELSGVADDIMLVGFRGSAPHGARIVPDRIAGCGPLGGVDAALAAARHSDVVLLACDMPFVSAGFIASLLAAVPGFDAVVPKTERGYHPLCAVYTRGCAGPVEQALAEGRLAMTALLQRIRVREVQGEDIERFGPPGQLLANINTPAEFEELEALPGHKL